MSDVSESVKSAVGQTAKPIDVSEAIRGLLRPGAAHSCYELSTPISKDFEGNPIPEATEVVIVGGHGVPGTFVFPNSAGSMVSSLVMGYPAPYYFDAENTEPDARAILASLGYTLLDS